MNNSELYIDSSMLDSIDYFLILIIILSIVTFYLLQKSRKDIKRSLYPFMSLSILVGIITGLIISSLIFIYMDLPSIGIFRVALLILGAISGLTVAITYGYFSQKKRKAIASSNQDKLGNKNI